MEKNSVVWSDSYFSWPPNVFTPHSEVINDLSNGISNLIKNGAQNIYIPFYVEETRENHNNFANLCKNENLIYPELKAVCFEKEGEIIKYFLEPIKKQMAHDKYATNKLENFLINILIANRVKAHFIDRLRYGPMGALENISELRNHISNCDCCKILDKLEGHIRVYSNTSILGFTGPKNFSYDEIKNLRNTQEYKNLSLAYYEMGRTKQSMINIENINRSISAMANSSFYRNVLKVSNIAVSVVAASYSPIVSLVEYIFDSVSNKTSVEFVPMFIESSEIGWFKT